MKACTGCKEVKPDEGFYYNNIRNYFEARCKECTKKTVQKWRKKNPEAQALINKRGRVKWAYNLKLEDVKEFGECPLCLKEKKLVIDHCHAEGHVRGFICYNCNTLLGHVENKEKMARINEYIKGARVDQV
jgi:post-segregation antitoxin (ccd killing protein)